MTRVDAYLRRRLRKAFVAPVRAVARATSAVASAARKTEVAVITVVTSVVAAILMLLRLFSGVRTPTDNIRSLRILILMI